MARSITVTGMNRPNLFRDLIASLVANDLAGWTVFVALEPSDVVQDFLDICAEHLGGVEHHVTVNPERLGVRANPYAVLSRAFAGGSDLNIYLEEDLVVSGDLVDIALWYEREHRDHWLLLNLLAGPCGSAGLVSTERFPSQLVETRLFNSIGFVLRRQEWLEAVEPVWLGQAAPPPVEDMAAHWRTGWGWDWAVYALVAASPTLRTVQPLLARATHVGAHGVHCTPEIQDRYFTDLRIGAGTRTGYELVPVEGLPRALRSSFHVLHELTDLRLQLEAATAEKIRLRTLLNERGGDAPVVA